MHEINISFIFYEFNARKNNYIVDKVRLKLRRKEPFEYLTVCFLYTGVDFDFIIFIHCEATLRKREKGSSHDLNFCVWINLSITCQTKVVRNNIDHAKALFALGGKDMLQEQEEMCACWLTL